MMDEELFKAAEEGMNNIQGYIAYHNFKIVEIKQNYCVMEAPITDNALNPIGYVHGGFIFGLADTAGGMAARTTNRNVVTINAHIDYLYPAKGNKLKAVANCVKDGKNITVYEVDVYDENDKKVSHVGLSYFYLDK